MPNIGTPGAYVRRLATQRRLKAVFHFGVAVMFLLAPFFVSVAFQVPVGPLVYLLCLGAATWLGFNGRYLLNRAKGADQGARAEEQVSRLLAPLEKEGWHIEYNLKLPYGGDVDAFLMSPKSNAYIVEVKSHAGEIVFDRNQLKRRRGHPLEKDFIKQVLRQVMAVKKLKRLRWVTALLTFTRARVNIDQPDSKVRDVYVVEGIFLLQRLRQLDNNYPMRR